MCSEEKILIIYPRQTPQRQRLCRRVKKKKKKKQWKIWSPLNIRTRFNIRRRQWHPTPVLWPGKSHGWRSQVGCSSWDRWVRHDWATSLSLFTLMHWRRKWQPTPVFLPGESQGRAAWRAAVYGVAQSRTRLKWLSSSSSSRLNVQEGKCYS